MDRNRPPLFLVDSEPFDPLTEAEGEKSWGGPLSRKLIKSLVSDLVDVVAVLGKRPESN